MICLIPTSKLMRKTSFLLPLVVVLLMPTSRATLSADSPHNINIDQLALLALKSHVTHDPRNLLSTNWSTNSPSACNWIGITCGFRHHRVTALNISGMGLIGTIPPHLGNLSFLSFLYLSRNSFHGSLPIELANLHRLKYLDFDNNSFSGEIPLWFGFFTKLESLILSRNNFTGVIPSTLGHLSKLETLDLQRNYFKGQIPTAVGNLSNLKSLVLSFNELSGEIPSVIGNLTSLGGLSLHHNNLTGVIPSTIGHLTSLTELFLNANNFTGEIPPVIGNLTSLTIILLWDNSLTGRIPTLPLSVDVFSVESNQLDGEIPSSICNLGSMELLDLWGNNLGGIIPECLGNLSLLNIVLDVNNFHDKIPDTLFPQSCLLKRVHISNNQLEGPIPQSLLNCKDLEVLNLEYNKLNDTFPSWLGNLKKLHILDLRSNRFYGHIANPEVASFFSQLQIIDLSDNDFSGRLPTKFFANLWAIINSEKKGDAGYMINFYKNGIYNYESVIVTTKGSERQFSKILFILTVIDFSKNRFTGQIPEILGELYSLLVLNLSHNSLTGPIPSSFSNLLMIESLDLSSNKLQGRIPVQLVNLNFLEVLNLSWNNLTGLIPRGNQFDTFQNDSYIGNLGLCGFPLSKGCDNGQGLDGIFYIDARRELNWKYSILMGYGCGLVFGLSMGYIVFTTEKPWWFIQIIDRVQQKYVGRKIRISGGR